MARRSPQSTPRVSGSIESEQSLTGASAVARPVLFRKTASDQPIQIINWQRLRCDRCGGPLFLDETDIVTRRYDQYNWPLERPIAGAPEVGGDACPVQVHVDGNRGCRRVVRQAPLFAAHLGQGQAPTAELVWNRHAQITRRAQLLEVLIEEAVVAIVAWRRSWQRVSRS
jgi:hypothetical protein